MHDAGGSGWAWLEQSGVAQAMRQWLWLYPAVEIVHIIGFVLLVGGVIMFDLRLLGLSPRLPLQDMARHLLPWSWLGLALIVPSGLLMFSAHASEWVGNPVSASNSRSLPQQESTPGCSTVAPNGTRHNHRRVPAPRVCCRYRCG